MTGATSERLDRNPPHSREAEQGVIGSMLIGGAQVVDEVRAALATDAFYIRAHQLLFDTLGALHDSGRAIDLITYTQQLTDAGLIESVAGEIDGSAGSGVWYVTRLFNFVPTAANVTNYLEIVREKWLARQMIATCTESIRRCYEEQDQIDDALNQLQGNVIELSNLRQTKDPLQHIGVFVPEAIAQIKAAYYGRGQITGLPTGFVDFDRMTNGLEKGYVYVIAGRPAMGKTSYGLGLCEFIAVENAAQNNLVQVFSCEMTGVQLTRRMICAAASVSLGNMRYGFLGKEDVPKCEAAGERLIRSRVFIDHQAGLNAYELRARARRAVIKRKAKLIIIDQLSFIHGVSRRARENRQVEVSEVMQIIAETAKELQVPIVVLAQLNRNPEERKWGMPELSDLRESGDIENYAHLAGLLWRPVYYTKTDAQKEACARSLKIFKQELSAIDGEWHPILDSDGVPTVDLDAFEQYAQIIIAKQREGATGPCPIRFVKEYTRFESMTSNLFSNNPDERQELP